MQELHNFFVSMFPMFVGKFEIFIYYLDAVAIITIFRVALFLPDFIFGFRKRV